MPFLPALPPPAMVAACATPPHGKVIVVVDTDAWDIRPTIDMAQLGRMAKETGLEGAHPAYGFYSSSVAYAVRTDVSNAARDVCQGPLEIRVMMRLTNRHIGIAKDIPEGSCRFARITAHYRHHAEADEAMFQRYVLKLTATLGETKMAALIATAGPNYTPARITATIDAMIEPVLAAMDTARSTARKAVDTPGEVEKLEAPCSESL
jgi:hypothetical protein